MFERGKNKGNGRNKNRGNGESRFCVCPQCGKTVPHTRGVPCSTITCPVCKVFMVRSDLKKSYNQKQIFSDNTNKNVFPEINYSICKVCGICVKACTVAAITLLNKKVVINKEKCTKCSNCVEACPKNAIILN